MNKKDPAFLFYSKDFYEGTRTMLPEERACYIDLMIYQHQHGFIPTELKRICLYCNGISEATVKAVLEAKFKLSLEGWYNETMLNVINERKNFTDHQSINGTVGQFYKKAKGILNKKEYSDLKEILSESTIQQVYDLINGKEINKASLEAMLIAKLKHLEDEDVIKDSSSLLKKYSFLDIKYLGAFEKWIKYKQAKKQSYANEDSLKLAYEKLLKLSGNNPDIANAIVDQSMANGWAGLFEFKGTIEKHTDAGKYDFDTMFPKETLSNNTKANLTKRFDDYEAKTGKSLSGMNVRINFILDLPTDELIRQIDATNPRIFY